MTLSRFQERVQRGLERVREYAGVPVIYRRGDNAVSLTAVPSQGQTQQLIDADVATNQTRRDFVFAAASLVLGGVITLPELGDEVVDAGTTYRVSQEGVAKEWHWSDSGHTSIRVHTVKVSA